MLKRVGATLLLHRYRIFEWLCIGVVYTLLYWPLLNSLLCITMAALWLLLEPKKFTWSVISGKLVVLFTSLFLVQLLGLLYTQNIAEGTHSLQQKSAILLFPVIFGTSDILKNISVPRILSHFVFATLTSCLIGLAIALFRFGQHGEFDALTSHHLLFAPNSYPYISGLFCLLSLTILLGYPQTRYTVTGIVLLSIFIVLLSVRLTIGLWLAVLLIYLLRLAIPVAYRFLTIVVLGVLVAVSFLTIDSLKRQLKDLTDISTGNTIVLDQDVSLGRGWGGGAIRQAIWACTWNVIEKHPISGVGTGDIQDSLQQAYEDRKFYFASRHNRYNAHNQYLQIWASNGIPGLLILLSCFFLPFILKKYAPGDHFVYSAFLLFIIANSLTEVVLDLNKGIIFYSFFNSIFAFTLIKKQMLVNPNNQNH